MRFLRLLLPIVVLILPLQSVFAEGAGGVVVRVPDDVKPRCIDPYKDRVWLTLRRLVTTKNKGWFTKDRDVAVLINTVLRADPSTPKSLNYPLLDRTRFGTVPSGQVSLPIEYPIISGLRLVEEETVYVGFSVEITLVNFKEVSGLGSALQALGDITGSAKLPIPSTPLAQGLSYLLDFANTAITKDIAAKDQEDVAKSAALVFNFDPIGSCTAGDFETTGTKAVVYSQGEAGPGYVDIARPQDYCWSADLTPSFSLKAAKKRDTIPCGPVYEDDYTPVSNNYVALFLNKQVASNRLGPSGILEQDRRESLKRCRSHGLIGLGQCPGGS